MSKSRKKNNTIYGLIAILIIAIGTIYGDKIKADNINNLVEQVSDNNETISTLENEEMNSTIDGENIVIHYLDVGQADSILIQTGEKNMLIDAGTNDMGKTVVKDLKNYGVERIDYLVGTHPHEDHIGRTRRCNK